MKRWFVMTALAVGAGLPVGAVAQARPVAVDVTVGLDAGRSTRAYTETTGLAAELTVAWRRAPEAGVTRVTGIALGGRGSPASADKCVLNDPSAGISGGCRPGSPSIAHLGVLTGMEQVTRDASGRVLIGPAFFTGSGSKGIGAQLQLDAAFPGRSHAAFVASLRGSAIRRFSGESLGLLGLSFGVRFQ